MNGKKETIWQQEIVKSDKIRKGTNYLTKKAWFYKVVPNTKGEGDSNQLRDAYQLQSNSFNGKIIEKLARHIN